MGRAPTQALKVVANWLTARARRVFSCRPQTIELIDLVKYGVKNPILLWALEFPWFWRVQTGGP